MIKANTPKRLAGNEPIIHVEPPTQLLDFWQWAFTDVLSNSLRGVFAEFLVAKAIGIAGGTRQEWASFDLTTSDGKRVEVKAAAFLQTWAQRALSKITFRIGPTRSWNAETNVMDTVVKHQSDVYVFCLLIHQDMETVDPLNLDQWKFFVLPTDILNSRMPNQKSISLSKLLSLNPKEARFDALRGAIEDCPI